MPRNNIGRSLSVSLSATGAGTLIDAAAGEVVRVRQFHLVAAGAVTVTFKSATTAITGAMSMITGVPNSTPCSDSAAPLFQTVVGEDLILDLSTNVQVSGFIVYDWVAAAPGYT